MAIFGGFFKKTPHQRFEYKPRYWDPDKEDLEQRVRAAKGESAKTPEAMKQRISKNMRRSYKANSRSARSSARRSNLLLFFIIGALIVVSYYLLTVYLPQLEKALN